MSGPFGSSQWMYNAGGGFYDYEIDGSLRFDNSGYLSRTNGVPTDEDVWTFSAWVKRSGTASTTGSDTMLGAGQYPGNNNSIRFSNDEGQDELIIFNGGSGQNKGYKRSRNLYRDNGAWYHVCVSRNGGTIAMEVNGVACDIYTQTGFDASVNSQNSNGITHYVGASERALTPFSGYMAEVNFIDGQALAASYFGETKSGIWIPKQYSGSYGNNGYQLKFNGNANDSSGNGNNFSSTNISSHDYVLDSPTNNFATLFFDPPKSEISGGYSLQEGNLKFVASSTTQYSGIRTTMNIPSTGKWYAEVYLTDINARGIGEGDWQFGLTTRSKDLSNNGFNSNDCFTQHGGGNIIRHLSGQSNLSSVFSFTSGDIVQFAVDADSGNVWIGKNNSYADGSGGTTGNPSTGSNPTGTLQSADFDQLSFFIMIGTNSGYEDSVTVNFGQDSTFHGSTTAGGNSDANGVGDFKYAVPTNFLALCTSNLPEPTFSPLDDVTPEDHFNTVLYTGNAVDNRSITGVGFQPDFVWVKSRSNPLNHYLCDVVRGANKLLLTNATNDEADVSNNNRIQAFESDGFQLGSDAEVNGSGRTYASWNWKAGGTGVSNTDGSVTSTVSANTDAGFSVVSWTGTGSSANIGHGLGVAPDFILIKNRDASVNWSVHVPVLPESSPYTNSVQRMHIDVSDQAYTNSDYFNSAPTSTTFNVDIQQRVNGSGQKMIAYCFANKDGYSRVGSYTGNSSSDGTFVYTGFRPAFIMIKKYTASDEWAIHDNRRADYGTDSNPIDDYLKPNNYVAEGDDGPSVDFLSNGFKWRINSGMRNQSGQSYIYLAFAEQPFKYANAR